MGRGTEVVNEWRLDSVRYACSVEARVLSLRVVRLGLTSKEVVTDM